MIRSRYAFACFVVVTGAFRLGIAMARANCRAVAATTDTMSSPSRRCACQSSGRVRVSVSAIGCGLSLKLESERIEGVTARAGDLRRQRHGLLQRQLREERLENRARIGACACLHRASLDHQRELA